MIKVEHGVYVPAYKTTIDEDIKEMEEDIVEIFDESTANFKEDVIMWKNDPKAAAKKEGEDLLASIEDTAEDVLQTVTGPFTSEIERTDIIGDDLQKTIHDITHPRRKRAPPRGSSASVTQKASKSNTARRKPIKAKKPMPAIIEDDEDRRRRFLKARKGKKKVRTGSKKYTKSKYTRK
ncbi:P2 [Amphibola crenata associated bacilladnavirus 2]|uniref:p2 n=1 Tax=Amphibola crenata associated bacilladnavirus 2 TaxID=1941436 RepID=A0A1P8YT81_9VIRU|nr:P2 [Amphibola crenata associated bacilladnavirus 2]AQA27291.1 P2 [Amphibola crenata associated bacilladnavirus 2]